VFTARSFARYRCCVTLPALPLLRVDFTHAFCRALYVVTHRTLIVYRVYTLLRLRTFTFLLRVTCAAPRCAYGVSLPPLRCHVLLPLIVAFCRILWTHAYARSRSFALPFATVAFYARTRHAVHLHTTCRFTRSFSATRCAFTLILRCCAVSDSRCTFADRLRTPRLRACRAYDQRVSRFCVAARSFSFCAFHARFVQSACTATAHRFVRVVAVARSSFDLYTRRLHCTFDQVVYVTLQIVARFTRVSPRAVDRLPHLHDQSLRTAHRTLLLHRCVAYDGCFAVATPVRSLRCSALPLRSFCCVTLPSVALVHFTHAL